MLPLYRPSWRSGDARSGSESADPLIASALSVPMLVFLFCNATTLVHSVRRPFGLTTAVGGNKPRLQTQSPRCNPLSLEGESRQKEGGGAAVTIRVPPPTHSTARPHRLFSRVRGRSSPRRTSTHSPR